MKFMLSVVAVCGLVTLMVNTFDAPLVFRTIQGEVCGCASPGDYSPRLERCALIDMEKDVYEIIHVSTCN